MLLEIMRESLVDGWDKLSVRGGVASPDVNEFTKQVSAFYRDEFLPVLQSLGTIGLLIAKYDLQVEWFQPIVAA